MALTVTSDLTVITNGDDGTWTDDGGGSASASETDYFVQGTGCRSRAVSGVSGSRGMFIDIGAGNELDFSSGGNEEDELIYMLHGEIRLGSLRLTPGSSVFIAANQLYSFRAGEQGFGFINYRRDASEMTTRSTGAKLVEAGAVTGFTAVNDLR